ncbi:beta-ketoacyl synthase chain length factor [Pseudoalteromonas carrageenovora]|uniref:beta-ketoacyl synthase chain length factor n=1 Tax=Pseudoalteromonas carrageenovora TaxID=227 RepID=UPI00211931BC|nr:beta-ketoacyl synthase chain length factor [Pseudoalteromonas carrageenovora]
MKFVVEELATWIKPEQRQTPFENWYDSSPITLSWVPAMQRRRMTPFVKMVLHSVRQVTNEKGYENIPVVFSSRHGDFHKTANLLGELAQQQPLSPTGFGLSVHNAAIGMYSIISGNTQPMNAIAAGKNSFPCALIEAYIKLVEYKQTHILLVHTDEALPEPYTTFADEAQFTHSISLVMRLATENEAHFSLTKQAAINSEKTPTPLSLECAKAMFNKQSVSTNGWLLTHYA